MVYFIAETDCDGNKLNAENYYELSGDLPEARKWGLSIYNSKERLIYNVSKRNHLNNSDFPESNRQITVHIGKTKSLHPFLQTEEQGNYKLILRFYQPEQGFLKKIDTNPLPSISKIPQP